MYEADLSIKATHLLLKIVLPSETFARKVGNGIYS